MKHISARLLALMFVLSLVSTPQMITVAANDDIVATPVVVPDTGQPAENVGTGEGDEVASPETGATDGVSQPGNTASTPSAKPNGLVQPAAASDLNVDVVYNSATGTLDLTVTTLTDAVSAGTNVTLGFDQSQVWVSWGTFATLSGDFTGNVFGSNGDSIIVQLVADTGAAGQVATASIDINALQIYYPMCGLVTPGN